MPVHVGEVGPPAVGDVQDRMVLGLVEPLHGDAVRHRPSPVGQEPPRAGTLLDEPGPLAVEETADETGIQAGGGLHHAILSMDRDFANGRPDRAPTSGNSHSCNSRPVRA